jgi:hypothetical protein
MANTKRIGFDLISSLICSHLSAKGREEEDQPPDKTSGTLCLNFLCKNTTTKRKRGFAKTGSGQTSLSKPKPEAAKGAIVFRNPPAPRGRCERPRREVEQRRRHTAHVVQHLLPCVLQRNQPSDLRTGRPP